MSMTRTDGGGTRHHGVYPALVQDIEDPDRLGRIKVSYPWLGSAETTAWATLVTPYADDDQGFQFVPAQGTQVLVAFEAGDLRRPYVLGACWNGVEAMPEQPEAANDHRKIRTRNGHELAFDDNVAAGKVTLKTGGGHTIELVDQGSITVTHTNGPVIEIDAAGAISMTANTSVDLTAPTLKVHAGTAVFDGLIQCLNLVTTATVTSPAYTPGAGNLW